MENNSDSNYRYERKFLLEYYSINDAIEIIKQNRYMFREVYEPRSVNNVYFDSLNFNSLNENINGLVNKRKIRIRWYGSFFDSDINAKLEVKIKEGHLGSKQVYLLLPFNITSSINSSMFHSIFK